VIPARRYELEERRNIVAELIAEDAPHQLAIDGQTVSLEEYHATSPPFTLLLPEENLLDVPAGVALVVAADENILIAPPPPGEYEITVTLTLGDEVMLGITRLIVQAPQVIEPEGAAEATPAPTT